MCIRDSYWVNQMLAEADGHVSFFTKRREGKALDEAITNYKTKNVPVSYTHLRAHETPEHLVCRLLLEKKNKKRRL